MLPLNRLGFFSSFEDQICPNGKLTVDINLTSDNNAIFRDGGDAGRYIITKMTIWVPKMVLMLQENKILCQIILNHIHGHI